MSFGYTRADILLKNTPKSYLTFRSSEFTGVAKSSSVTADYFEAGDKPIFFPWNIKIRNRDYKSIDHMQASGAYFII